MKLTKIFVDFNNADRSGRVRLNTDGSIEDIKNKGIVLKNGLHLVLEDEDEFTALGIVEFSQEENIWVAKITKENTP